MIRLLILLGCVFPLISFSQDDYMKWNKLTKKEEMVIIHKGTEQAFTGTYRNHKEAGIYRCKQCDAPLYQSEDKFDSGCGWPSFDDEIDHAVKRVTDADGIRTEILCANCGGHLGHVFEGEELTDKNVRHCVNSISLNFISNQAKAYFAGGCFWGVEYLFQKLEGVLFTRVGYMGGDTKNPTYEEVCSGKTGHIEAIEVNYEPSKISCRDLIKYFFEIHDPTHVNRQGPDIGEQYQSVIFYLTDDEKEVSQDLIRILEKKGYTVATRLRKADVFWDAEEYHQDYYMKTGKAPYCHAYVKRF